MIEANKYIFDTLASFVSESIQGYYIPSNKRCIATDDNEKEWLKKIKILKIKQILPNFKTSLFEYNEVKYFAVVGWNNSTEIEYENFSLIDMNAGIVTALIFELKLTVAQNVDPYLIAEQICYSSEETTIKYNYKDILQMFEPLSVFEIQKNSLFNNSINDNRYIDAAIAKISGFFIIRNPQLQFLKFSKETTDYFERVFWKVLIIFLMTIYYLV